MCIRDRPNTPGYPPLHPPDSPGNNRSGPGVLTGPREWTPNHRGQEETGAATVGADLRVGARVKRLPRPFRPLQQLLDPGVDQPPNRDRESVVLLDGNLQP